jgi:phospholipid-binding lipoprotein MlaA
MGLCKWLTGLPPSLQRQAPRWAAEGQYFLHSKESTTASPFDGDTHFGLTKSERPRSCWFLRGERIVLKSRYGQSGSLVPVIRQASSAGTAVSVSKYAKAFLCSAIMALLAACQSAGMPPISGEIYDPFESYNRPVFNVFLGVDRNILRPLTEAYRAAIPEPARMSVHNLLQNLDSPKNFANDVLRGRIDQAGTTLERLVINSTVGIAGLFDVAESIGLKPHEDDFGKTLATYGVREGPYFFFILFGPTNARDLTGSVVDFFFNPFLFAGWTGWAIEVSGDYAVTFVDKRERNLELLDQEQRASNDFYATLRDAYEQHRRNEIREEEGQMEQLPQF